MRVVLESRRLILRELEGTDLDFVAAMLADTEVMRYWPRPQTREEAVRWIENHRRRYVEHGHGYWLAVDRDSGDPVGQYGLLAQDFDGGWHTGLGWMTHRPYWRRGYAREAALTCAAEAKGRGVGRLIALIRPENEPSLAVARSLEMRQEGSTLYAGFIHGIHVFPSSDGGQPAAPEPSPMKSASPHEWSEADA